MYTHTLVTVLLAFTTPDQVLKSCLKISHLAKRVYTHTSYSVVSTFTTPDQVLRETEEEERNRGGGEKQRRRREAEEEELCKEYPKNTEYFEANYFDVRCRSRQITSK